MLKPVYVDWTEYLSLSVKQKGMWAVYVSNNLDYEYENDNNIWIEFINAAHPLIGFEQACNMIHGGLFFFETEKETNTFFDLFNKKPIYNSGLYACTFNNEGTCLTENT